MISEANRIIEDGIDDSYCGRSEGRWLKFLQMGIIFAVGCAVGVGLGLAFNFS